MTTHIRMWRGYGNLYVTTKVVKKSHQAVSRKAIESTVYNRGNLGLIEAKDSGQFVVHGDITIRGVTKPIALDVEFHGTSKNPYGKTVAGIGVVGTVNRKDFGVNFNALLETGGVAVGEKVKLELDIEATLVTDAVVAAMPA